MTCAWSSLSSLSDLSDLDDYLKLEYKPKHKKKNIRNLPRARDIPKNRDCKRNIVKKRRRGVDREDPFKIYDDEEFWRRFRLRKETVIHVSNFIRSIEPITRRSRALSAVEQLLITLNFFATGMYQWEIGGVFKVEQPTVHRVVHRICSELAKLQSQFICMPDEMERQQVVNDFYEIAGLPGVIGVLDCLHIKIKCPGGPQTNLYRNPEGHFSVNCQMVCDSLFKIRHISSWPGSVNSAAVLNQSLLLSDCETLGTLENDHLVGDAGYCLRPYLMTPVLNPSTLAENNYNKAHNATRKSAKLMFELLKIRFPCIKVGMNLKIKNMPAVIAACAILHNIAIQENDNPPPKEMEKLSSVEDPLDVPNQNYFEQNDDEGLLVRTTIINTYFSESS